LGSDSIILLIVSLSIIVQVTVFTALQVDKAVPLVWAALPNDKKDPIPNLV